MFAIDLILAFLIIGVQIQYMNSNEFDAKKPVIIVSEYENFDKSEVAGTPWVQREDPAGDLNPVDSLEKVAPTESEMDSTGEATSRTMQVQSVNEALIAPPHGVSFPSAE